MLNANISKEKRQMLARDNKRAHFHSKLQVLIDHNGWRKKNIHVLMAPSGSGKSTLIRTFVADVIADDKTDPRVMVYLSEETCDEFLTEFHRVEYPEKYLERLFLFSDLSDPLKNPNDFFDRLYRLVTENDIDILFLDNITTLMIYDSLSPSQQTLFAGNLKKLAQDCDIPLILVGHTGKSVKSNQKDLYDQEDMRGSNMPIMQAQFTYTLHMFHMGEKKISFLKQWKSRNQDHYVGFYRLLYDPDSRTYTEFFKANWENFEKVLAQIKGKK
jgi:archaellum biogenesis ATPase FlaH